MQEINLNDWVGSIPRLCVIEFSDGRIKRAEIEMNYYNEPTVWSVAGKGKQYLEDGTPRNGRGARIVGISISKYDRA